MSADNIPLPLIVLGGAATIGMLVVGQMASHKNAERRKRRREDWEAASDEHKLAALKITYPSIDASTFDISSFDERAAKILYGGRG